MSGCVVLIRMLFVRAEVRECPLLVELQLRPGSSIIEEGVDSLCEAVLGL
jgi:hypothetical protein